MMAASLIVLGTAVVAVVLGLFLRYRNAFKAGRDHQKVKDLEASNKEWAEADDIIKKAKEAGRRASPPGASDRELLRDDGYKRPTSGDRKL